MAFHFHPIISSSTASRSSLAHDDRQASSHAYIQGWDRRAWLGKGKFAVVCGGLRWFAVVEARIASVDDGW